MLATGVSRILGLVRDQLVAYLFGVGMAAEAFVVAFRLPNLFRDLVAEGAVTSAFVPVLSWYRARRAPEEFWRLSQALLARLVVAVAAIGLLGALAAPWIVRATAPGFVADPEKFALTVRLTRILFPFIILVGLWAYFMGLLNTLGHFAAPALGPAILNVAMIAACFWLVPHAEPRILGLVYGVMIGAVVQLLVQFPPARRLGFRWRWHWRHPGSRDVLRLLGPRTLGAAVYQGNVIVHTALASLAGVVGQGAVAALYFSNRLVQLPLALFGTASAQASLPSLSTQAAAGDFEAFRRTLLAVTRMTLFVMLPSAAGLIVLATPIVRALFERGAFDSSATQMTASAVVGYSLGLGAYTVSKIASGAFYALQDTRTPVRLAAESVLVNIILSVALMAPLQVFGLALSAALSNTLNAVRLLQQLQRRLNAPLLAPLAGPFLRITAAAVLMAGACWLLWEFAGLRRAPLWGLAVMIPVGGLAYVLLSLLLRVRECTSAFQWLATLPLIQNLWSE